MATLAKLTAFQADLEEALYSGTRRVRGSDGKEEEYRSEAEVSRALAKVKAEIRNYGGAANTIRFQTSKGL